MLNPMSLAPAPTYHLYAIGNALVDAEYEVSEALLRELGVDKRHMTLIDLPRRHELLAGLQGLSPRRTGGGSAGNTVVALAQLGGRAFFSCRLGPDELGDFYRSDLAQQGVRSSVEARTAHDIGPSGSCLVLVTPDAERSMCTFLGVSADVSPADLDTQALLASQVFYMEGYLSASPSGLEAALEGRALARRSGVQLAATLSDVNMVKYCRSGLQAMLGDGLDYLFCNEEEAQVWCGVEAIAGPQGLDALCDALQGLARTVCLTRGALGCVVIEGPQRLPVSAPQVTAVDTNGAGDMFAGAFLYARTHGHGNLAAARLANAAAARVVSQHGNRLTPDLLQALKGPLLAEPGAASKAGLAPC
jgi:sugar/nucleoside kinase (ribokinase family)